MYLALCLSPSKFRHRMHMQNSFAFEIDATQPRMAALHRLRPLRTPQAECLVHLSFVHPGTAGYNITAHALTA